jgi:glycerate-2-kinase
MVGAGKAAAAMARRLSFIGCAALEGVVILYAHGYTGEGNIVAHSNWLKRGTGTA